MTPALAVPPFPVGEQPIEIDGQAVPHRYSYLVSREETDPDPLREMVSSFVHLLMSAEADALCGAGYGE